MTENAPPTSWLSTLYSAKGELVTPTGAALVRVLSSEFGRPPHFVPGAIGEHFVRIEAAVVTAFSGIVLNAGSHR